MAKVTDEENQCYSYQPRSDLLFSLANCPRIHIEVCSDPLHGRDRYRLLLQAGLLVRVMNTNRGQGNSFVFIAIYITKTLTAEWYLVFQPSTVDGTVGITKLSIIDHWSSILCRLSILKRTLTLPHTLACSGSFTGSTISPLPSPPVAILRTSKDILPD